MSRIATIEAPSHVAAPTRDRLFFSRMAYACAAVGVIGFSPTYWIPLLTGDLMIAPILHVHAMVFYGWLAMFVVQSGLVASRQVPRHRSVGMAGVALATAMCFVGAMAAVHTIRVAETAGFGSAARAFSVVPLTGIAFFAALFVIAVVNVSRPDVHKRLMLVATVSLLNAAVGRLFLLALGQPPPSVAVEPPPVFVTIIPGLVADALLVPALLYDRSHFGRVHRTYWIAGAALIASQFMRVPLAATDMWQRVAAGVTTLMP
jgi:hypothetical protein